MITSKSELRDVLMYEKRAYYDYMFPNIRRRFMGILKHEPIRSIWKWQKASRLADYYQYKMQHSTSIFIKILYVFWIRRRNVIGEKLGIEFQTVNVGKGLFIYHFGGGIVANNFSSGRGVHLHGNNCIGNGGKYNDAVPTLGNDVTLGVGAKIIGGVTIADGVTVAAGAVVVRDILEPGCTVAGVPARIVKSAITR